MISARNGTDLTLVSSNSFKSGIKPKARSVMLCCGEMRFDI
jgi:hypothetical protein